VGTRWFFKKYYLLILSFAVPIKNLKTVLKNGINLMTTSTLVVL